MKTKILLTFILAFIGIGAVNAQSCHAYFVISGGCGPTYQFTNYAYLDSNSSGTLDYYWNFYDSLGITVDTSKNPTYTYTTAGTYNVCLIVTDGMGCWDSICQTITYDPNCDSCNIKADFIATQQSGATYRFNSYCYQSAPAYPNSGIRVDWDFGDGSGLTNVSQSAKYHTYSQPGWYYVCVTAYDTAQVGCSETHCDSVYIDFDTCYGLSAIMTHTNGGTMTFGATVTGGQGPFSYSWNFGDGNGSGVGPSVTHSYDTTQSINYLACLTVHDSATGCNYIVCDSIEIDTCHLNLTISHTQSGDTINYTASVSGGTGAYQYNWNTNNQTYTNMGSTFQHVYYYTGNKAVGVTVIDTISGCTYSIIDSFQFFHSSGANICGSVTDSIQNGIDSGVVYLIQHDSVNGTLTLIDSLVLHYSDSGYYCFKVLHQGDYLVKAALLSGDPHYNAYFPTYHTSSVLWSGANKVTVAYANIYYANISLVPGSFTGGPGFIGGLISAGANKTNNIDELDVTIILKDANGKPIAFRKPDANHRFEFDNLAYGTYTVMVDIFGRTSSEYTVVLSENNQKEEEADFIVNSTYITTSVKTIPFTISNNVYPNPASDAVNVDLDIKGTHTITLDLVDMQGRVVATTTYDNATGVNTFTLSTEQVQAGVYMLRVKTNDFSTVNKIIISK